MLKSRLKRKSRTRRAAAWVSPSLRRSSIGVLFSLMVGVSVFLGWHLSQIQPLVAGSSAERAMVLAQGTVDVVPPELKLSQEIYLARCSSCHIGIPPAVLPAESWKAILQDTNHYGVAWDPLRNPDLALAWKYLRTFSRPLSADEQAPYRIKTSRYFKILHPKVKFTAPIGVGTCVSCHIGASKFNFRELSPQWQNGP